MFLYGPLEKNYPIGSAHLKETATRAKIELVQIHNNYIIPVSSKYLSMQN